MVAEWNPGSVLPIKPSVYERDYTCKGSVEHKFCLWDGKSWHGVADTKEDARFVPVLAANQSLPWREIQPETTSLRVSDANA